LGTLHYGRSQSYEFDDRTLEHLRVAINARLRKNEAFMLSWHPREGDPADWVSLWITADMPIGFSFSAGEPAPLSREWVSRLIEESYGPDGLVLGGDAEESPPGRSG